MSYRKRWTDMDDTFYNNGMQLGHQILSQRQDHVRAFLKYHYSVYAGYSSPALGTAPRCARIGPLGISIQVQYRRADDRYEDGNVEALLKWEFIEDEDPITYLVIQEKTEQMKREQERLAAQQATIKRLQKQVQDLQAQINRLLGD